MDDYNLFKKELDKFLNNQQYDLAEKKCNELLARNPSGFLYNYLGYIYYLKSDYNLSIKQYNKALSYKQNESIIFQNIAECYLRLRNFIEAKKNVIESLSINLINLNNIKNLYYLSNYDLNYSDFYRLLEIKNISKHIKSNNLTFINDLINFLTLENETDLLLSYANSNLILNSFLEDEIYYLKGYIFFSLNLFQKSKDFFLKVKHKNLINQANVYLLDIYSMEGKSFLAYKFFLKLFKSKLVNGSIYRLVSLFYKFKSKNDNLLVKINSYLNHNKNNLNFHDKANIYFALAKAHEDIKDYKSVLSHLKIANNSISQQYPFNLVNIKNEINFYKNNFTLEFYEKFKDKGYKNIKPIFIVGLPRSGSTKLEQIISNSQIVDPLSEVKTFRHNLKYFFNIHDPQVFKEQIKHLKYKDIYNIGEKYHKSLSHLTSKIVFIDKMLFNFHYLILIKTTLPNSKIIITKRNYKDTFLSIYKNFFSDINLNFAYDENNILSYIKVYDDMIKFNIDILKNEVCIFDYDSFVHNPNHIAQKIFEYCEIKWKKDYIDNNVNTFIPTVSTSQVRKKIYSTSSNSYKNYSDYFKKYYDELEKI